MLIKITLFTALFTLNSDLLGFLGCRFRFKDIEDRILFFLTVRHNRYLHRKVNTAETKINQRFEILNLYSDCLKIIAVK